MQPVKTFKKLIETALPLDAINAASAREKSIRHGHPSTLHLWWARRPLAAARAVIFAQMVDDPSAHPERFPTEEAVEAERQRLFAIIEELVKWENTTNEEVLQAARNEIRRSWVDTCAANAGHPRAAELFDPDRLPAFHDPFAGGGALPLEAQRLGLEAYASDLNPVAVLINKAMIEIPPRFAGRPPVNPESRAEKGLFAKTWRGAEGLAEDVRYYGKWMRDEAEKRIGHLYPKVRITAEMAAERPDLKPYAGRELTVIAWLWARTVRSPNPAFAHVDVPLASTFMLSTKAGKEAYVQPIIEGDRYRFAVRVGKPKDPEAAKSGTKVGRGGHFRCLLSGAPIPVEYIRKQGLDGTLGQRLMAIVCEGSNGRVYIAPDKTSEQIAMSANPAWKPEQDINHNPRDIRTQLYGLTKYSDLFTSRQLVALTTFSDLVLEARERARADATAAGLPDDGRGLDDGGAGAAAYADAIGTYLGITVSKATRFTTVLSVWRADEGKLSRAFGRQAIPMTWDFAETNPFSDTGGDLSGLANGTADALEKFEVVASGISVQGNAATSQWPEKKLIISTDPPYYDNIGYADLSDYFYVWLRQTLRQIYPELFATLTVPKEEELIASRYRHGGKEQAEEFFLHGMTLAMNLLALKTHPGFPVTIYYAFKQEESDQEGVASTGWQTFLQAVVQAGFSVTGTWPVRTEGKTRTNSRNSNALASSIVLVCRPRPADAPTATRRDFLSALKAELPRAMKDLQRGNIAPVDLAQAAIGPGMAVYTRYGHVVDAAGNPLTVRDALALINQTLDEVLAEQEGEFDADTRWAVAWFENAGFAEGEYGVAETLSKAKNTSVGGMAEAGIVASRGGKVRLLRPDELQADWNPNEDKRPTVWEMVHHLSRALDEGGEPAAAGPRSPASWPTASTPSASAKSAPTTPCATTRWCSRGRRSSAWPATAAAACRSREDCCRYEIRDTRYGSRGTLLPSYLESRISYLRKRGIMAITNYERVGKSMDLLREGLTPFVGREMEAALGKYWVTTATAGWRHDLNWPEEQDQPYLDVAAVLRLMWENWNNVFNKTLGHAERSLVSELRVARNKWAHQEPFSSDDAYRALDSADRLLTAVSAPQSAELQRMKNELLRVRFDEQARGERRKSAGTAIESAATGGLTPWREVASPHRDVASGRYQQAEFAADLWQVHLGEGTAEYRDAAEFFRRTYLTESLRGLLVSALRRLAGSGGDPVVQLQTNFGGGKTHSMLALYHLFSGAAPGELLGVDAVMKEAGVDMPPAARRVVLVGNKISPGNPSVKPDGTLVHTLWGELAWQLGGRAAYERVRADDERATSPGDTLRELMNDYGPCLILIDEWVAYARQLHDTALLPAGTFETHFTFAQALTESAKTARNCQLVISLPASDTGSSPHLAADDVEVGGARGRAALDRLRNAVGRVEASWRPASAEEGFEIVRRRLFEPLMEQAQYKTRDTVARAFYDLYRTQGQEFPPEAREADYEKRLRAAYPIHPEVFDRLYNDWSTLVKFQRTRGVLRLMAAVIHSLWEKGDRNPLILPANIPIDDPRVQFELTRYLSDNWVPVIEKDVDGPNALPLRIDGEVPNLGKHQATRRVARAIYLGSAPTATAANRGIEDRRIKLGCVMPGESVAVFGDALRRLSATATYLYQDGARYWYSTQPTVTKLAEDRAEQLRRDRDAVGIELDKRLRADLRRTGDFRRVHPLPGTSADVPDDLDSALVVLGIDHPHSKDGRSAAEKQAQAIWEFRGNTPRLHRNTLAFLAVDATRLEELGEATRRYLAWQSILDERAELDLTAHQVKQAETQRDSANSTVNARLPEAYQWLLAPVQDSPTSPVRWASYRLSGQDALAERAAKKLRSEELLITTLAGTRLRMELDRVPLWRGNHVSVRQLIEDFAQYPYLPRLKEPAVLLAAIHDGLKLIQWPSEAFAYADRYDEASGRYIGLRAGQLVNVSEDGAAILVRPDVARRQMERDRDAAMAPPPPGDTPPATARYSEMGGWEEAAAEPPEPALPRRFHGTVALDPVRAGAEAGRVAEEVIAHLAGLVGANVRVTLEIEADIPNGAPDNVVRIVTENGRALKFTSQGFERE